MLDKTIKVKITEEDALFDTADVSFAMPEYSPENHYWDLTNYPYFKALLSLRHFIKKASDSYFGDQVGAKNIDLFMLTPSVSSPMGPGSDSEPIKIQFGDFETNLVDSSQFGFEPLLINGMEKVYCYLPSMRGETPDARHLNQFFHCEAEVVGTLDQLIPVIEDYVRTLCETVYSFTNIIELLSIDPNATKKWLKKAITTKSYPQITFDEAIKILQENKLDHLINFTDHGRDISAKGEIALMKLLKAKTPVWIKNYDRDRVPFYQKPDPCNSDSTINADLIFPPISDKSFGGEIVGAGQRQDTPAEMYESLKRQSDISPESYEWYIKLREHKNYRPTSGFGIGIERFLAWSLAKDNIRDVIIYPRLKNVRTYP